MISLYNSGLADAMQNTVKLRESLVLILSDVCLQTKQRRSRILHSGAPIFSSCGSTGLVSDSTGDCSGILSGYRHFCLIPRRMLWPAANRAGMESKRTSAGRPYRPASHGARLPGGARSPGHSAPLGCATKAIVLIALDWRYTFLTLFISPTPYTLYTSYIHPIVRSVNQLFLIIFVGTPAILSTH